MIPWGLVFGAIALTLRNILFYKYTSIGISVLTCLIQVQIKFNKLQRLPRILLNGLLAASPPFEHTFDSCTMISEFYGSWRFFKLVHTKPAKSFPCALISYLQGVYTTGEFGFPGVQIQCFHFKPALQKFPDSWRNGKVLIPDSWFVCKRENESGTKTFRIHLL